jgi:hypothetical protein
MPSILPTSSLDRSDTDIGAPQAGLASVDCCHDGANSCVVQETARYRLVGRSTRTAVVYEVPMYELVLWYQVNEAVRMSGEPVSVGQRC